MTSESTRFFGQPRLIKQMRSFFMVFRLYRKACAKRTIVPLTTHFFSDTMEMPGTVKETTDLILEIHAYLRGRLGHGKN